MRIILLNLLFILFTSNCFSDDKSVKDPHAKYENPTTFREYAINNMIDHKNALRDRKDITEIEKGQLYRDLGTLILHEKDNDDTLSLVSRNATRIEKVLDQFGYDLGKKLMEQKLTPAIVSHFPQVELVLKKKGLDDEFLEIISSSISDAIDSLKKQQKQ